MIVNVFNYLFINNVSMNAGDKIGVIQDGNLDLFWNKTDETSLAMYESILCWIQKKQFFTTSECHAELKHLNKIQVSKFLHFLMEKECLYCERDTSNIVKVWKYNAINDPKLKKMIQEVREISYEKSQSKTWVVLTESEFEKIRPFLQNLLAKHTFVKVLIISSTPKGMGCSCATFKEAIQAAVQNVESNTNVVKEISMSESISEKDFPLWVYSILHTLILASGEPIKNLLVSQKLVPDVSFLKMINKSETKVDSLECPQDLIHYFSY